MIKLDNQSKLAIALILFIGVILVWIWTHCEVPITRFQ